MISHRYVRSADTSAGVVLYAAGVTSALRTYRGEITPATYAATFSDVSAVYAPPGTGADPADVWNYVLASGLTANQTVSEIHAMLSALTAGSVVIPTDVKKVNGSTIYGTGIYPSDVFRSTP